MTMMIIDPYRYVTGGGGGTAPTFRISVKKQGGGTSTGITTVSGDAVCIFSTSASTDDPATPTDSNSNTWSLIVNFADSGVRIKAWIASNITGGASHTFTGAAIADGVMYVVVYGGAAASPLDADTLTTLGSGTGAITTSGTIDVAYNTVITACLPVAGGNPLTFTCNTGYTIRVEENDNNTYYGGGVADKNPNSVSAQSATWANSSAAGNVTVIFCIKGV